MTHPDPNRTRGFDFEPTPAVTASRIHTRFVDCFVCQADHSQYLFHRTGVRFVRCRTCGAVYVNPINEAPVNYFDVAETGALPTRRERALVAEGFGRFLDRIANEFGASEGRSLASTLLLGKFLPEFATLDAAGRTGLTVAEIEKDEFVRLAMHDDLSWATALLVRRPDVVILHEVLEACSNPASVVRKLVENLPPTTWFVVTYTNVASFPARLMRRYWPYFFSVKTTFYNTGHLTALFGRLGYELTAQFPFPVAHTAGYLAERLSPSTPLTKILRRSPLAQLTVPVRAGNRTAIFKKQTDEEAKKEKVSIVMPVFNEALYCEKVIETVLSKQLSVDREVIIVESNSTDGTRDIVEQFEGRPGVRVIFEERPRGKGHAVRTGLEAITGTIVIIQDADFEYDIDDYDALLEPILQNRTSFVLGSRTLGLDDWKVRRFGDDKVKGLLMNAAQLVFARTYNLLYQQKVTDVNTMFKVFRANCLNDFRLESDGFELDIELACKLAKTGNSPMEVPVNYVSRSFAEGKKISFFGDFFRSYSSFFKYRLRD
jgi:hypothetical protein